MELLRVVFAPTNTRVFVATNLVCILFQDYLTLVTTEFCAQG